MRADLSVGQLRSFFGNTAALDWVPWCERVVLLSSQTYARSFIVSLQPDRPGVALYRNRYTAYDSLRTWGLDWPGAGVAAQSFWAADQHAAVFGMCLLYTALGGSGR